MQYALIKDNNVVNVIVAEPDFIASIQSDYDHIEPLDTLLEQGLGVCIGWTYDGEFHAPDIPPVVLPTIPQEKKITRLAFLNRFTDGEAIALDLASIGNTVEAASIRRYLSKVNAATFIDLEDPDTRGGVQTLEVMGLISEGRALVILDTPVTDKEKA